MYVTISARYALSYDICRPYLCDLPWSDITVYVPPKQIKEKQKSMSVALTEEQAECICLNELIALKLLKFDAFVMHAAILSYEEKTYAFCAPRGVGKSTHAALWKKQFGDKVTIINGDKPIIRRQKDGRFLAYGTPWCGKEGWNINIGQPLDYLCFLERADADSARIVTQQEYVDRIIHQVVFPPERVTMGKSAALLAAFMRATPAALIQCTPTENAAICAYRFWNKK